MVTPLTKTRATVDRHGRVINYLRLSITDLCNLRCFYCMPNGVTNKLPHDQVMRHEENLEVVYYPKYATPERRPYDSADLPEGLTMEEYFEYANVDVPEHSFKPNVAVPWLARALGL